MASIPNGLFVIEGVKLLNGQEFNGDEPNHVISPVQIAGWVDTENIGKLIDTYTPDFHMPSVAYRSVNGVLFDRPITILHDIVWHFEAISQTDIDKLLYNDAKSGDTSPTCIGKCGGIRGIIKDNKSAFFYVRTKNEEYAKTFGLTKMVESGYTDWYGSTFYYGDQSKFNYIGQNNGLNYYSGEIHWIQVKGHDLNIFST